MHTISLQSKLATFLIVVLAATAGCSILAAQMPPQARTVNLQQLFHTRSAWQFVVTEAASTKDYGDNDAPGALTLCLRKGAKGPCVSEPVTPALRATTSDTPAGWEPHYLLDAKAVYPRGREEAPLLLIVTGSLNAGNGDQIVATQLIAYDPATDAFRRLFQSSTGRNNNQEIRFISDGPLRGSLISAEPQQQRPYGYWITVNQLSSKGEYQQVLRYGSATRYNDGNQLAVIDSEMLAIQQRLGMWKPGYPLPIPKRGAGKSCIKPQLRKDELWCK